MNCHRVDQTEKLSVYKWERKRKREREKGKWTIIFVVSVGSGLTYAYMHVLFATWRLVYDQQIR